MKKKFTLIELPVTTAQQICFSKNKNDTSLRPQGRTSRIFDNSQKCSSHLHGQYTPLKDAEILENIKNFSIFTLSPS